MVSTEQPEDLGDNAAAISLEITKRTLEKLQAVIVTFDQGPFGAVSSKPTAVAGTLQGLEWLGVRDRFKKRTPSSMKDPRRIIPSEAAQYPPGLTTWIADLAIYHLKVTGKAKEAPPARKWKFKEAAAAWTAIRDDADEQACRRLQETTTLPLLVHDGTHFRPFQMICRRRRLVLTWQVASRGERQATP